MKAYFPRQTALVTCRAEGKDNIITLDWHMPTSFSPKLYCISVGKTRYSHEIIKKSRVFAVNFMPIELEKEVLFCGRHSGRDLDKFSQTKLEKEKCSKIDCARIKQALAFAECKVVDEMDTGDHTIFIGEVLISKIQREGRRVFHVGGDDFTTTS